LLRRPKRLMFCWSSHVTCASVPSPCGTNPPPQITPLGLSQAREGAFGIGGLGFAPLLYLLHLWISVGRAGRRQNRGCGPPLIRASGSGIAAAARFGTGWSPRAAREKGRGKGFER
jgi:hypothetical protein